MTNWDEVIADLLAECQADHVGLWEVVQAVQTDLRIREPAEVRSATLEIVRQLINHAGVEAGFPTPDGRNFQPWPISKESVVNRIADEWDALGRLPNIGDIVWFSVESPHASL